MESLVKLYAQMVKYIAGEIKRHSVSSPEKKEHISKRGRRKKIYHFLITNAQMISAHFSSLL